jgi:excisionase family DNA binding protein
MDDSVLLPTEVAARLRCSRRQVYDLFNEGELLGFRVGTSIRIHLQSVKDYIDRHSNRPPQLNKKADPLCFVCRARQPLTPAVPDNLSPRPRSIWSGSASRTRF